MPLWNPLRGDPPSKNRCVSRAKGMMQKRRVD
jgi:hypothetical protein